MNKTIILTLLGMLLISVTYVEASENLPIGLQKIIDYNNEQTADFALKISFLIAFVAGMLGILSPCILPFLPAYFSLTFKEKKNVTKMTFIFFLGFSFTFVFMGVVAGFIGEHTLSVLQTGWLVSIAGVFMVLMGIIVLKGQKMCNYVNIKTLNKYGDDTIGTFLFGLFFALGWTACLGPILGGILGIGAIMGNIWKSALLLFFYSLGNLIPLFILSIFYDKFKLSETKLIKGKMLSFNFLEDTYHIHSTNLISGLLFIILGITVVIFNGTRVFNTWDFLGTKDYFYSIQDVLINSGYANYIGIAAFILLGILFYWYKSRS